MSIRRSLLSALIAIGIFGSGLLVGPAHAVSYQVLAQFPVDWNNARNDGIGAGNSVVTPGSPQDIPQQGHQDTVGSGNWQYGRFAPGVDLSVQALAWDDGVQVYDRSNNNGYDTPIVGPNWAHPDGSGAAPTYSLRIWQSGVAGNVTIAGTIQVPDGNSDGVQFAIIKNSDLGSPLYSPLILPANGVVNYSITTPVAVGDFINFAIGPGIPGSGANSSFDTTFITGSIFVPEPSSLALLEFVAVAGGIGMRRRRK